MSHSQNVKLDNLKDKTGDQNIVKTRLKNSVILLKVTTKRKSVKKNCNSLTSKFMPSNPCKKS